MPEYPDIEVYCDALRERVQGGVLHELRLMQPFFLRTAVPPVGDIIGQEFVDVTRLGKRIVFTMKNGLYAVVHLMVAGRLKEMPLKKGQFAEAPKRGLGHSRCKRRTAWRHLHSNYGSGF